MSRRVELRAAVMGALRKLDGSTRPTLADVYDYAPPQYTGQLLVALAHESEERAQASYRETEVSAKYALTIYSKRGIAAESVSAVDAAVEDVDALIAADPSLGVTDFSPRARIASVDVDRGTELDGSAFALVALVVTYRTSATAP